MCFKVLLKGCVVVNVTCFTGKIGTSAVFPLDMQYNDAMEPDTTIITHTYTHSYNCVAACAWEQHGFYICNKTTNTH